jgi:ABC-type multidrug transport system ATPase subunit
MCAIGRALMTNPSMVLLDEPSMGLAPQIVEEVFNIVQDLNSKEKVTFLLAEQNTNMALKYADYGYIMESGRVVMDGRPATWPATRTSRSSTWAWAAASARASRTSRATSGASAGWREARFAKFQSNGLVARVDQAREAIKL